MHWWNLKCTITVTSWSFKLFVFLMSIRKNHDGGRAGYNWAMTPMRKCRKSLQKRYCTYSNSNCSLIISGRSFKMLYLMSIGYRSTWDPIGKKFSNQLPSWWHSNMSNHFVFFFFKVRVSFVDLKSKIIAQVEL